MRKIAQEPAKVLRAITNLAAKNGGSVKIDRNSTFMPVHVEIITSGTWSRVSVAHYGKQNGDLMRDPDIVFAYPEGQPLTFYPESFRNDYMNMYQEALEWNEAGAPDRFSRKLMKDIGVFTSEWMQNIKQQQGLTIRKAKA